MNKIEYLNQLITKNNGIIKSSKLSEDNIPRQYLKLMLEKKLLTKVSRGIYIINGNLEDELYIYQQRYAKGIFSHETALYIHNFTDRMLYNYIMTFPQGYHIKANNNFIIKQANLDIYNLGIQEKKTSYGNKIRVYNIERTLSESSKGRKIVKFISNDSTTDSRILSKISKFCSITLFSFNKSS